MIVDCIARYFSVSIGTEFNAGFLTIIISFRIRFAVLANVKIADIDRWLRYFDEQGEFYINSLDDEVSEDCKIFFRINRN